LAAESRTADPLIQFRKQHLSLWALLLLPLLCRA
jgi:hypothetical protein